MILGALAILLLAAPVLATSLDQVMKGQAGGLEVEVKGTGHYFGDCIEVSFTNSTGQTETVRLMTTKPAMNKNVPANIKRYPHVVAVR